MVRASIYNEKGGVGKTTITAMLASYLSYVHGKSVCILDFDYPSYHFMELRREELAILKEPRSPLSLWLRNNPSPVEPYDVFSFPPGRGGVYAPREVFTYLQNVLSGGYDYVFYDFPGRFAPDEPVSYIAASGFLDFAGIPMDTDVQ
ncbi:MAG: ParA family protein, partial [Bacteroidales bacterium]|nr:ParA family protein [Bacteroidales bacterium]